MFDSLWPNGLYSPLDSSVCGISQVRTLEWVAIPFSWGSSRARDWTQVSCIASRFFTIWATHMRNQLYDYVWYVLIQSIASLLQIKKEDIKFKVVNFTLSVIKIWVGEKLELVLSYKLSKRCSVDFFCPNCPCFCNQEWAELFLLMGKLTLGLKTISTEELWSSTFSSVLLETIFWLKSDLVIKVFDWKSLLFWYTTKPHALTLAVRGEKRH